MGDQDPQAERLEVSGIQPIKWPRYRTPLPTAADYLAKTDQEINAAVIDGLKNHDTTVDILNDIIDRMHTRLLKAQGVIQ